MSILPKNGCEIVGRKIDIQEESQTVKLAYALTILCSLVLLVGCGSPSAGGKVEQETQKEVVNPNGDVVKIPVKPERIADLSGSTEELLLLGIKPVASGNVDYGKREEFSPTIKNRLSKDTLNIGWYAEPINLEAVTSAEPDLIILGTLFNENLYEQLSQIAPTVVVPAAYYDWRERFDFLAKLFGEEEKKEKWLADYDRKAEEWKQKLAPITKEETFVIMETYPKNLVIYSNKGAAELVYQDLGLKRKEGIPATEHWGGTEIGLEALAAMNPDHFLLMESGENQMNASNVWNHLKAVQKGNIYKITQVDNYNYSYTAIGRLELLDRIGSMITEKYGK